MIKLLGSKKSIKISVIILVSFFLLVIMVHEFYSLFPEKTKKINANILTVEGHLPSTALEKVKDEFQHSCYEKLVITGLNFTGNYLEVAEDGYLIFYPKIKSIGDQSYDLHIIEVNAYSELGGKNCAHFNLFVNKTLMSDFYAGKQKKKYVIRWKGKLEDIDSVTIQFDNARVDKWGDRNLYVKEIIIDHKIIIPYLYNSVYDIGSLGGNNRIINNFSSNAEETRNDLIRMNVNPSSVVAVPGEGDYINNTLKIALAFRDWLKVSKYDVKGINIMSFGPHARRKYMIYNKILGKDYRVGIIYFPDYKNRDSFKNVLIELREFLGLVYYWVILRFY
jgi:hypothetical protein